MLVSVAYVRVILAGNSSLDLLIEPGVFEGVYVSGIRATLSRLTTLRQAVGDDEGLEVEVIDIKQEVGDGESEEAEGKKLEGDEL